MYAASKIILSTNESNNFWLFIINFFFRKQPHSVEWELKSVRKVKKIFNQYRMAQIGHWMIELTFFYEKKIIRVKNLELWAQKSEFLRKKSIFEDIFDEKPTKK